MKQVKGLLVMVATIALAAFATVVSAAPVTLTMDEVANQPVL